MYMYIVYTQSGQVIIILCTYYRMLGIPEPHMVRFKRKSHLGISSRSLSHEAQRRQSFGSVAGDVAQVLGRI